MHRMSRLLIAILVSFGVAVLPAAAATVVSQKGRSFRPGEISVARGEIVTFTNEDSYRRFCRESDVGARWQKPGPGEPRGWATGPHPVTSKPRSTRSWRRIATVQGGQGPGSARKMP